MTSWMAEPPRDAGVIRPSVVIFDVVGTLASLDPVRVRLQSIGQPAHVLDGWFARLLRDGIALTLAGGYRPFGEVAASALAAHTYGALGVDQINYVTAGFGELTVQPDAVAAVQAAAAAGAAGVHPVQRRSGRHTGLPRPRPGERGDHPVEGGGADAGRGKHGASSPTHCDCAASAALPTRHAELPDVGESGSRLRSVA
jgi:hypothetical protein